MELILLVGAVLNFTGAVKWLVSAIAATASEPIRIRAHRGHT